MKKEINEILKSQVSNEFIKGMIARMEMSYFKYGDIREAYPNKIHALKSLRQRIKKYLKTKNTEFLIDAANFCMIEFMLPKIDGAFFKSTDSDQSPGRVTTLGIETDAPNIEKWNYKHEGD